MLRQVQVPGESMGSCWQGGRQRRGDDGSPSQVCLRTSRLTCRRTTLDDQDAVVPSAQTYQQPYRQLWPRASLQSTRR